jgi:hypothetical protein
LLDLLEIIKLLSFLTTSSGAHFAIFLSFPKISPALFAVTEV